MTMITASRFNVAQPVRFGGSVTRDFAANVVAQMGEIKPQQRQAIYQFLQAVEIRKAEPRQELGPVLTLITGARRHDFANALASQSPNRPLVYLDAAQTKVSETDSVIDQLFDTGLNTQESVKSLLAKGQKPLIVLRNVEELPKQDQRKLAELFHSGALATNQERIPLNMKGLEIVCTSGNPREIDSPFQSRCISLTVNNEA